MKFFSKLGLIILTCFLFNNANAQNDYATLNVTLQAIQSIQVNPTNKVVNLAIANATDYTTGKSSGALTDHLQVLSTGLFTVSVKASGALTNGTPANDIPLSALTLTPALGSSTTTLTGQVYNTLAGTLTTTDQAFIKATNGTSSAKYTVNYALAPGTGGNNLINRPAGTYSTTITYTIAPN